MRILTVSAFFETHGGGIEKVAAHLARALARRGHRSMLAGCALDPLPTAPEVETIALEAKDFLEPLTGLPMPVPTAAGRRALAEAIEAAEALVIHDCLYASSWLAVRHARRLGKPWLLVQHIGAIPYANPLLRKTMELANGLVTKPMLCDASQAIFISAAVRDHFGDVAMRRPPELMFNGVDHDCFKLRDDAERQDLRQTLCLDAQRPQILFVGRFVEKKGLAVLEKVAAAHPEWDFLLVGGGPIDPVSWNLPNVRVLGRKSALELSELYSATDLLLLPSVGEGFPLVIQEAMACGLPIVCGMDSAAADPSAEGMLAGVDIDLTRPDETARFVAATVQARLGSRNPTGAEHARSAYDWDNNARRIERMLAALAR